MTTDHQVSPDRLFMGYTDGPLVGSVVKMRKTMHLKVQGRDKVFRTHHVAFIAEHVLDENSQLIKRTVSMGTLHMGSVKYGADECVQAFHDQLIADGYKVTA